MILELVVTIAALAASRGILDGPVHVLELTIGPWMAGFCKPVVDFDLSAGQFQGVGTQGLAGALIATGIRRRPSVCSRAW